MILSINDRLELNIECITQLCGINVQKKNNIIQNIVKYFSNTKYAEYEDKDDCVFKIDDEVVGRKYYTTYYIANISDLISNIQISKNSIMKKHVDYINSKYDNQLIYEDIVAGYEKIFAKINSNMKESGIGLMLDFTEEKITDIAQLGVTRTLELGYIEKMRKNIAEACGIDVNQISVKATTEEKLGFTGSGEGISATAVCLLI